jgi:ABC-type glutathione transport system ATPase component
MSDVQAPVLAARAIKRGFRQGPKRIEVLEEVSLEVRAGTSLAIVGASGAGLCCISWEAWTGRIPARSWLTVGPFGK